jgi:mannonate dehydratase
MNRRQFISSSGVAALAVGQGSTAFAAPAAPAAKPVMMKLGCQSAPTNDTHLKYQGLRMKYRAKFAVGSR